MTILQICRECGFPITDDPRIAREQAVCCCEKPKGEIAKLIWEQLGMSLGEYGRDFNKGLSEAYDRLTAKQK